jgi:Tfp pilus assembly protein PilZ
MHRWTPRTPSAAFPETKNPPWEDDAERRGSERVPFEGRIIVMAEGRRFSGSAGNISSGGTFIRSENPPAVGEQTTLLVQVDRKLTLHIRGIVRWHELDAHHLPIGFGLQFVNVTQSIQETIDELVDYTLGMLSDVSESWPGIENG